MLNHIVLMGRLTRDPELRRTGSGVAVASFTLAVDRDFAAHRIARVRTQHRRGASSAKDQIAIAEQMV